MNPITEEDIANFLVHTPDFFIRQAELLASIRLTSPHSQRAISLQERQAEMLREKIRALESRIMEMIRHGSENTVLTNRLHQWAQHLLLIQQARDLPRVMVEQIEQQFMVPQVALKVWSVHSDYINEPFAQNISEEARQFACAQTQPYCGSSAGVDAVQWLPNPAEVQSVALVSLHRSSLVAAEPGSPTEVIGLLVLASPDPERYHAGMGTDLLERMGQLASAALARLQ